MGAEPCYTPPIVNPSVSSKANIVADVPFQGYASGSPWIFGMGEVAYYYNKDKDCNKTSQTLTKPIIFIDGFDALDKREIPEIYDKNLAFEQNGIQENLGDNLRDKGYDLIVLNFPVYVINGVAIDGGTDYIERNAMVLVKLIQQVNAQLAAQGSTEKLVIIGPSMGGLISKYALAYMEKYKYYTSNPMWEHNTRLWISFDAPHHGANIPIGAQEFLKYYANVNKNAGARASLDDKINSVAAKQMVLHHHLSNSTYGSFGTGFAPFRTTYRVNADGNGLPGSNGFPMNVRKLAIANGSQSGATTGNPGDLVLRLEAEKKTWLLFWYDWQTFSVANIRMSGGYGNIVPTLNAWTLTRSSGFSNNASDSWMQSLDTSPGGLYNTMEEIATDARSSTNNWFISDRVRVDVYNPVNCFIPTKSALSFSSGGTYGDSAENLTGRSLVCNGETPFDAYYAPLQNEGHVQLSAGNVAWIMPELDGIKNVNAPPIPVIIPINITASSGNTNCLNQPQMYYVGSWSGALSTTWTVTGDWTIQGANNLDYVIVIPNGTGVGTIRVEIVQPNICFGTAVGIKQVQIVPPADYNVNFVEQTNDILCIGTTKSYLLNYTLPAGAGAPIGSPIITYSRNLLVTQTATGIDVQAITEGAGSITVVFTNTHSCFGSIKGRGTISFLVGAPPRTPKVGQFDSCFQTGYLLPVSNATHISINGAAFVSITGPIYLMAGTYTISLSNNCGTSPVRAMYITDNSSCKTVGEAPKKQTISISPNPSSGLMTIENILAGSKINIYDNLGRVMFTSATSEGSSINIDISSLKTGIYILEGILPNNEKTRKNIVRE